MYVERKYGNRNHSACAFNWYCGAQTFLFSRFAYIEFADKESVRTAMALDESLFRGRQIKVRENLLYFAASLFLHKPRPFATHRFAAGDSRTPRVDVL